jgi:hypothetical protein
MGRQVFHGKKVFHGKSPMDGLVFELQGWQGDVVCNSDLWEMAG